MTPSRREGLEEVEVGGRARTVRAASGRNRRRGGSGTGRARATAGTRRPRSARSPRCRGPAARRRESSGPARRRTTATACCRRRGPGGSASRGRGGRGAARRAGTGSVRTSGGAAHLDPLLAKDLREGRREVEGRVDDGDVARPGPPRSDGSRGDDPRASRVARDADARAPPAPRRDASDRATSGTAARVEAEARAPSGPEASRDPHEDDVVVVRERGDRGLPPVLLLRGRPVRVRPLVVEEGRVEEQAVADRPDAARRERRRPGAEDGQRVVVVEAPGDRRVASAADDEATRQRAVGPELAVLQERRPEPVVRARGGRGRPPS